MNIQINVCWQLCDLFLLLVRQFSYYIPHINLEVHKIIFLLKSSFVIKVLIYMPVTVRATRNEISFFKAFHSSQRNARLKTTSSADYMIILWLRWTTTLHKLPHIQWSHIKALTINEEINLYHARRMRWYLTLIHRFVVLLHVRDFQPPIVGILKLHFVAFVARICVQTDRQQV